MRRLMLGAAAILTGCAVMKIDVDVYKGPLSNHEDVQQQQLAVMATSAKPLLIALRDAIEWSNGIKPPGYQPDYIDKDNVLTSEYGKRVNAVLSLYKDESPGELMRFAKESSRLSQRYQQDITILNGDYPQRDTKKEENDVPVIVKDTSCEIFNKDPSRALVLSFRYLTSSSTRNAAFPSSTPINQQPRPSYPLNQALDCLAKADSVVLRRVKLEPGHVEPLLPKDPSTNALFRLLAERSTAAAFGKLLMEDPFARIRFENRLVEVAEAYLDARQTLSDLLTLSLNTLVELKTTPSFDAEHPTVRRGLGHLISQIVQPRAVVVSTCMPEAWSQREWSSELRSKLRKGFLEMGSPIQWDSDEIYADADLALEAMILTDPEGMRRLIMAAGNALRTRSASYRLGSCPEEPRLDRVKFGLEYEFGATRGPTLDPQSEQKLQKDIEESLRQIEAAGAIGFESGRLARGIESMTDQYLRFFAACHDEPSRPPLLAVSESSLEAQPATSRGSSGCSIGGENWRQLREELSDSLIHFAEKILFVANYDVLLADTPGVTPKPAGGSTGKAVADTEGLRRRYTLVLQAVGNSILNQLDELKFRRAHDDQLRKRGDVEFATLRNALAKPPAAIIDELVADFRASAGAQSARREASDAKAAGIDTTITATAQQSAQSALDAANTAKSDAAAKLGALQEGEKPLIAAYTTVAGGDSAETKTDADSLKAAVVTSKSDTVTGAALVDEVVAWLDGQVKAYVTDNQTQDRPTRLAAASKFLRDQKSAIAPSGSPARADGLAAIISGLKFNKDASDAAIAAQQKLLAAASQGVTKRQQEFDKAKAAAKAKSADVQKAKEDSGEAATAKGIFSDAAEVVSSCKDQIVASAEKSAPGDTAGVFAAAKAVLGDAKAPCVSDLGGVTAAKVVNAANALAKRNPPLGWSEIAPMPREKGEDRREVLDRLIAALQYARVQATQQDASGARGDQIAKALAAAYEYRSGMAYLRPAGAYLRNSYPATALQNDPGLGWRNLLGEESERSIPILGRPLTNQSEEDSLKIQSQIDKQFWQTINSVRVTGGGTTNYVIAKDDIGNWYVKAYDANPKPIIEAAQNLALFSLGNPGGALSQVTKPAVVQAGLVADQGGTGNPAGAATAPAPPLEQLFTLHKTKYEKQTQSDYDHLRKDLTPDFIRSSITTAWAGDGKLSGGTDALAKDLDAALGPLGDTWKAFTDTSKPDEQASRIIDALNSLLYFHTALNKKIGGDSTVADPDKRNAAQSDVDQVIGRMLNQLLTTRQAAAKDYGTAISYIGEVVQ